MSISASSQSIETATPDLAERKAAEVAMAKVHRLEALRELSIGLRHELNNSLTALRGEIQRLQQSPTIQVEDSEGLVTALKLIDRITATTRRLVQWRTSTRSTTSA